jgi:hypothetical protein
MFLGETDVGAVACAKHGTHPGILCCDHIREGCEGFGTVIPFSTYGVDLVGNGGELLDHLICADCAERFQLSTSSPIDGDVWEDKSRFPHVCPTCEHCLMEWRREGRET